MSLDGDAHTTSVDKLMQLYEVTENDLSLIQNYGKTISAKGEQFVKLFYEWLENQSEYKQYFSDPNTMERVQGLQGIYWTEFFKAKIDQAYVDKRIKVGDTHARIGLPLPTYFASMNISLRIITETLYDGSLDDSIYAESVKAVTRLIHLDTAVVVAAFVKRTNKIISDQHKIMMEMSTPVTEIWDDILILPLVGIIDSKRAQDIMTAVLSKISETHAKKLILDISGVAIVDTAVANHLIKITKSTKLMGCTCTISGISPAIAQTMVELGINVVDIRTTATLKDALQLALSDNNVVIHNS